MKARQKSASAEADATSSPSHVRPIVQGVARYDLLEGASGREINFRPPRYPTAELGPVGASVEVMVAGATHQCDLHDVSQNGIAFEWVGDALAVGSTIPVVCVTFDHHEAYRGEARVGSVRVIGGRQIVGVSFVDTLMNIDDVLQLRDVKAWSHAGPSLALGQRSWHVGGHERFKALVADLRLFFIDVEEQLAALEASLPWHVAHGEHDSPARLALIERVRREVVEHIITTSNAIDAALRGASAEERQALREFSQRHLQSYLMQSPWMRRAKEKPLGYPGDFEIMNSVYGPPFVGATLFAKALSMAFVSTAGAAAVRERKNMIKAQLHRCLETKRPSGRPIRILSIAAGPAQETYELLQELEHIEHPVEIVLFEQDKGALTYSYSRLNRVVASRWSDRVKVTYLHDSIKRLLRDPRLFSTFGEFDFVFSCGLFDYLQHRTAASLAGSLYGNVAQGGSVLIGNMTPANPSRWFMELHLDWYLIYREHEEILAFARAGAPSAKLAIVEEATGVNPFVRLTRD